MSPFPSKMSDDQYGNELAAQRTLVSAIDIFRRAIQFVNHHSSIMKIDQTAFDNFIRDELPDSRSWDEMIEDRRHGL